MVPDQAVELRLADCELRRAVCEVRAEGRKSIPFLASLRLSYDLAFAGLSCALTWPRLVPIFAARAVVACVAALIGLHLS
eukprot:CAMPEP_0115864986 /NCGR_PEP_ID=MMETSP0287-20121206/19483_1 /TAXON_ID=412157 /ORGANISM="Chrysochromulina rotalis, Strain UIO044" /LENGTH=79 /DNA_ID=CAMNT_0003319473 /DNA_START=174 /DNA_END=410 /DNA_ORIENTATION=-